jgi:hypothetical protein
VSHRQRSRTRPTPAATPGPARTAVSPARIRVAALAAVALAAVGAACGGSGTDGAAGNRPTDPTTLTTTPATGASPGTGIVSGALDAAGRPVADAADDTDPAPTPGSPVAAPTTLAPAQVGLPEFPARNAAGETIVLDETALLACAGAQIAWVHRGEEATAEARAVLGEAALRAAASAVGVIAGFAPALETAAAGGDLDVVDAVLSACTARGFAY